MVECFMLGFMLSTLHFQPTRICLTYLDTKTVPPVLQFYNLEEQKCHECAEDPGRFYSELLDECMQCSEVADRILDGSGKCVLLEPCKAGEYVSQKPTDSSAQVCSKVSACKDHEYESAAPGRGSDRQCLPITPTCKRGVTYEIAPPTLLSDRVCRPVKRDSGPPSWTCVCERGEGGVWGKAVSL